MTDAERNAAIAELEDFHQRALINIPATQVMDFMAGWVAAMDYVNKEKNK